jgi:hypothetical protein
MFKFNTGDHVKVVRNLDGAEFDYLIGACGFVESVLPQISGTDYMLEDYPDLLFHESELKKIDSSLDEVERGVEKTRVFQAEYADA